MADGIQDTELQVATRLVLAEALIHTVRGLDEEGIAALHAADRIAMEAGDRAAMAEVRIELGYVDFLRARYDRSEYWLVEALARVDEDSSVRARHASTSAPSTVTGATTRTPLPTWRRGSGSPAQAETPAGRRSRCR